MDLKSKELLDQVVAEASTWIGTPFGIGSSVKGRHTSCFAYIAQSYYSVFPDLKDFKFDESEFLILLDVDFLLDKMDHIFEEGGFIRFANSIEFEPGDVIVLSKGNGVLMGLMVNGGEALISRKPFGVKKFHLTEDQRPSIRAVYKKVT